VDDCITISLIQYSDTTFVFKVESLPANEAESVHDFLCRELGGRHDENLSWDDGTIFSGYIFPITLTSRALKWYATGSGVSWQHLTTSLVPLDEPEPYFTGDDLVYEALVDILQDQYIVRKYKAPFLAAALVRADPMAENPRFLSREELITVGCWSEKYGIGADYASLRQCQEEMMDHPRITPAKFKQTAADANGTPLIAVPCTIDSHDYDLESKAWTLIYRSRRQRYDLIHSFLKVRLKKYLGVGAMSLRDEKEKLLLSEIDEGMLRLNRNILLLEQQGQILPAEEDEKESSSCCVA
jgi:hypothetical protein